MIIQDGHLYRKISLDKIFTKKTLGVAQAIADGKTTKETAEEWNISHRTVEAILNRLKAHVEAKSRIHLIAELLRNKIIE
jgi:DNA-binding NarL/FixJ family response regulator